MAVVQEILRLGGILLVVFCIAGGTLAVSDDSPAESGIAAPSDKAERTGEPPSDHPFRRTNNLVFAEVHGIGLLMDVFSPVSEKNGRAIVDVVSGAFFSDRGKMRDHERAGIFDVACRRGYTVFAIRPGSVSKFNADEMVGHVRRGIEWVKRHADEYKIDPNRIALMGASAGGYLACQTAVTSSGAANVHAVGVFFPVTDFLNFRGEAVDMQGDGPVTIALQKLLFPHGVKGWSDERVQNRLRQMSPVHRAHKDCPPFLFIHGDADSTVPLAQSEKMRDALKSVGVDAKLIVKEGGGHPWPTIQEEVEVLVDWFDEQLAESPQ